VQPDDRLALAHQLAAVAQMLLRLWQLIQLAPRMMELKLAPAAQLELTQRPNADVRGVTAVAFEQQT
jgi:hypothetical protein